MFRSYVFAFRKSSAGFRKAVSQSQPYVRYQTPSNFAIRRNSVPHRGISLRYFSQNNADTSLPRHGVLTAMVLGGFAISCGILLKKPLALERRDPRNGDEFWAQYRYVPPNWPRSLDQTNEILRWSEGSQNLGGSVIRVDSVEVPSNFPGEDTISETAGDDDNGMRWFILGIYDGHA